MRVRERAEDGQANQAVVKAIAAHYGVAAAEVRLVHGHSSRRKLLEISGLDNP